MEEADRDDPGQADLKFLSCVSVAEVLSKATKNWRVSPHCNLVNLVRSGRKQPQPIVASAGGKARLLFFEGVTLDWKVICQRLLY